MFGWWGSTAHMGRSESNLQESVFAPSSMWVPKTELELRSSDFVASSFTCRAISLSRFGGFYKVAKARTRKQNGRSRLVKHQIAFLLRVKAEDFLSLKLRGFFSDKSLLVSVENCSVW